jgi:choline dehydrogenase
VTVSVVSVLLLEAGGDDALRPEAGDPGWSYESVLKIYRAIEDWHGAPDPKYRGTGGPVFIEPAPYPNPIAPAMIDSARLIGIPTFENQNGAIMEGEGGASIIEVRARNGKRVGGCPHQRRFSRNTLFG